MKALWIACLAVFTSSASANLIQQPILNIQSLQQSIMSEVEANNLPWTVGDYANYNIDMGFLKGTMEMKVREEVTEGFWLEQNVDMMIQKQKIEMLVDKTNGQILQLLVNGEKQSIPEPGQTEIIDMKEETITVPAGTFLTTYLKIKDSTQDAESQIWVNTDIPIAGMVQQKQPSQFGEVTIQLTSFKMN